MEGAGGGGTFAQVGGTLTQVGGTFAKFSTFEEFGGTLVFTGDTLAGEGNFEELLVDADWLLPRQPPMDDARGGSARLPEI